MCPSPRAGSTQKLVLDSHLTGQEGGGLRLRAGWSGPWTGTVCGPFAGAARGRGQRAGPSQVGSPPGGVQMLRQDLGRDGEAC